MMRTMAHPVEPDWQDAMTLAELRDAGVRVARVANRQIALFFRNGEAFACNNRCPHEGYPLKEGTLSGECVLTCHWHNWKFDLRTGRNLLYGDDVRVYRTEVRDGIVRVDVADPPASARRAGALAALRDAFSEDEFYRNDRLARELARFQEAGGEPLDAIAAAVRWTHDRLPDGMTHAHAAAPDWLRLRDMVCRTPGERLAPVLEIIGHLNRDTLREHSHPYGTTIAPWDATAFGRAVEDEDQETALAIMRGGLADGLRWNDLEPALARAAVAHYQDFGHAAIYVFKTRQLLEHLGDGVLEPLCLALGRALVLAWREDLTPEFRAFGDRVRAARFRQQASPA